MKTTLHSNMFWNIPRPDTYSQFNCDLINFSLEEEEIDEEKYWDLFSFYKWRKAVCKAWTEVIYNVLCDITAKAKKTLPKVGEAKNISSPKEYNFSTDCCSVDVEFDDLAYLKLYRESTADEEFGNYLKEFNSSRSGFISFMPNNIEEFIKSYKEKQIHILIDYFVYKEYKNSDYLSEIMYENIDCSPLNYLNDSEESKKLIESIYGKI